MASKKKITKRVSYSTSAPKYWFYVTEGLYALVKKGKDETCEKNWIKMSHEPWNEDNYPLYPDM